MAEGHQLSTPSRPRQKCLKQLPNMESLPVSLSKATQQELTAGNLSAAGNLRTAANLSMAEAMAKAQEIAFAPVTFAVARALKRLGVLKVLRDALKEPLRRRTLAWRTLAWRTLAWRTRARLTPIVHRKVSQLNRWLKESTCQNVLWLCCLKVVMQQGCLV